jgi:hypothetical protein
MRKKMQPKRKYWKKREKEKKRGEVRCLIGNRNDEDRGTHFCFFSDITEVT